MAEIHAKGLVHMDLKANNVMVQQVGPDAFQAHVIDVGMAALPGQRIPFLNVDLSKYNWMCPQAARRGPVTFAADVYALGRLLTNVEQHLQGHPAWAVLKVLAKHALAKNPRHRPTLGTFINTLRGFVE